VKKSSKQVSEREKKEKIAREGKKYWENLTEVLPRRTFRVWGLLDKLLSKYHHILLARHELINEMGQLNTQND
jgi:dynein regulatory complex protein 1